jgi:hypothetical protein
MLRRAALLLLVGFVALTANAATPEPSPSDTLRRIEVHAQQISAFDPHDEARRRFGQLEFRGGLVLTSPDKAFGGLSGLHVDADGRHFISISDRGQWLQGDIRYDGIAPAGIADAEMGPMLDRTGKPLTKRGWYDSESLAVDGGTLYVGFERIHRIARFAYGKDGLRAHGEEVPTPARMRKLPSNKGIEGLVFVPRNLPLGDTLIAFSERGLDAAGNRVAFLLGGPAPGTFALQRHDDFDLSDAALLPPDDILVLERKFNWIEGIRIRIRRIALAQIKPGAVLDGPVIFEANLGDQIDNMEGLAVHRSDGQTVLTLVSDDNLSPLQRTLLLQFTLVQE